MKKNKVILISVLLILFTFSLTAYSADFTVSNLSELQTTIISELYERNKSFDIVYKGEFTGMENVLNGIINVNSYLHSTITKYSYSYKQQGKTFLIEINADHIMTKQQEMNTDKKIDEILKTIITPNMNDHQKIKAAHDWIVKNSQYDTSHTYYSPYDLLTKGKSVCNGYALLTYKMMNKLNIPVKIVFGSSKSVDHVWVMVKAGDYWFHLDTTWDDPIPDKGNEVSYNYYMLTTDEISKDHSIENADKIPNSSTLYYKYLNDLSVSSPQKHIYQNLMSELSLDIYASKNTASSEDSLDNILQQKIKSYPAKISVRYNKNIEQKNVDRILSNMLNDKNISTINFNNTSKDKTDQYIVLTLYIEYASVPESITTTIESKNYNILNRLSYKVYANYNGKKEDITQDVSIHPYNTDFVNIKSGNITFKNAGSEIIVFDYKGKQANVKLTALSTAGLEYITSSIPSGDIKVTIFGENIDFSKTKQEPVIENGRTLVPVRAIFEVLNCNVTWDSKSRTATIQTGSTRIKITADSRTAFVNGNPKSLDVPARIVNDRIIIPLRFVGETLNKTVNWNSDSKTVSIY